MTWVTLISTDGRLDGTQMDVSHAEWSQLGSTLFGGEDPTTFKASEMARGSALNARWVIRAETSKIKLPVFVTDRSFNVVEYPNTELFKDREPEYSFYPFGGALGIVRRALETEATN